MNPGTSTATRTGCLPMAIENASTRSITAAAVCAAGTISTRATSSGGLNQ